MAVLSLLFACFAASHANTLDSVPTAEWKDIKSDFRGFVRASSGPVLIKNSPVSSWGAARWTPEGLRSQAGNVLVPIKNSTESVFYMGCCKLHRIPLREVIDRCAPPPPTSDPEKPPEKIYFSGPIQFLGSWIREQTNINMLDMGEVSHDSAYALENGGALRANLWIGNKGVVTPAHFDEMHNFFIQVYGEKTFQLFPPSAWRELKLYPKFHHQHRNILRNLEDPKVFEKVTKEILDRTKSPPLSVTVTQGDILYVPPLWFHRVETKSDVSISINVWSASAKCEKVSKAWMEKFPIPLKSLNVLTAYLAAYIQVLIQEFYGYDAELVKEFTGIFRKSRYGGLKGKDIVRYSPIPMEVDSQELIDHSAYIKQVEESSPSLFDESNVGSKEFKNWCEIDDDIVKEMTNSVPNVLRHFKGLSRGMGEIYLGNFIEDMVSQVVGFKRTSTFMKTCVQNPILGKKNFKKLVIDNKEYAEGYAEYQPSPSHYF
ncbi:hypothetical protein AAMO2058_001386600 [Amorphochlora amoebiformis]